MLKNTKKAIIIVQCIILIFSASFYSNANTKNINQSSSKEQPVLDYNLEDLPNVIKNTILANENNQSADKSLVTSEKNNTASNENKIIDTGKKAECITTDNMNDLYSITVKNEDNSNTIYSFQAPIKYIENGKVKLKQPQLKESKKIMGIFANMNMKVKKIILTAIFQNQLKMELKLNTTNFHLTLYQ